MMKTKTVFGFVLATLIALIAISFVAAGDLSVNINEVSVNDVELGGSVSLAAAPGETVPVVVRFSADEQLEDLKLKVWIDGYKSDVSATTSRFDVVNGSTYIKRLSLTLPDVRDMEDNPEGLTLHVRIADKNDDVEEVYSITLEKDAYAIDFLSVEMAPEAMAGEIVALEVVIKNVGGRDSEDTFVSVTIPELGISKKAYFGDVYSTDNYDNSGDEDDNNEDARAGRIYLAIPSDAESGDYTVEVEASNYDVTSSVRKILTVEGKPATNNTGTPSDNEDTDTDGNKMPVSILVLTIVLVVVFVVLLIVLIVLLTKKPSERTEDFGETSYY